MQKSLHIYKKVGIYCRDKLWIPKTMLNIWWLIWMKEPCQVWVASKISTRQITYLVEHNFIKINKIFQDWHKRNHQMAWDWFSRTHQVKKHKILFKIFRCKVDSYKNKRGWCIQIMKISKFFCFFNVIFSFLEILITTTSKIQRP